MIFDTPFDILCIVVQAGGGKSSGEDGKSDKSA